MISDAQDMTMKSLFTSMHDDQMLLNSAYNYRMQTKEQTSKIFNNYQNLFPVIISNIARKLWSKHDCEFMKNFHRTYHKVFGEFLDDAPYYDEWAEVHYYSNFDDHFCHYCNTELNQMEKLMKSKRLMHLKQYYVSICNKCNENTSLHLQKNPFSRAK